jgi:hypothetical protein
MHRLLALGLTSLLVVAFTASCSSDDSSSTSSAKPVLAGDKPTKPTPVQVTPACATALAPVRKIIADNDFQSDLDLDEMTAYLQGVDAAQQACVPEEFVSVSQAELLAWTKLIPPTYATDKPAVLSSKCANALEDVRSALNRLGPSGGSTPEFTTLLNQANDILRPPPPDLGSGVTPPPVGMPAEPLPEAKVSPCTEAEVLVFTLAELDPPQRRSGALPGAAPAVVDGVDGPGTIPPSTVTTPSAAVSPTSDRAKLSKACADQLESVRETLSDAKGDPVSEKLRDDISLGIARADKCTPEELTSFQQIEVAPALGLTPTNG